MFGVPIHIKQLKVLGVLCSLCKIIGDLGFLNYNQMSLLGVKKHTVLYITSTNSPQMLSSGTDQEMFRVFSGQMFSFKIYKPPWTRIQEPPRHDICYFKQCICQRRLAKYTSKVYRKLCKKRFWKTFYFCNNSNLEKFILDRKSLNPTKQIQKVIFWKKEICYLLSFSRIILDIY